MLRKTPLKRTAMKKRRKKDRRPPAEKIYFVWLLDQPCAVTGLMYGERSHVRRLAYGAGTSKKPPDWFCIPLHPPLHKELHRGDKTWEAQYGPQEKYLLQTWQRYGLDKIPEEVQAKILSPHV